MSMGEARVHERLIEWLAGKASSYLVWVHERERRGMPRCPDCGAPEIDCVCDREDRIRDAVQDAYDRWALSVLTEGDEIDHGHPLYTGAMKLGAISDPEHPRFSQHVDEWNPEKLRAQRDEARAELAQLRPLVRIHKGTSERLAADLETAEEALRDIAENYATTPDGAQMAYDRAASALSTPEQTEGE